MMALPLFILLLLHYFLQTSLANPLCTPSACGIFRNISYPFRLKDDPAHCGDRRLELSCENNVTFFTRNSHKYYVRELNYVPYFYLRVADPSVNISDTCSFPNSSSVLFNSVGGDNLGLRFYTDAPITFISCSHPLKNSSTYIEVTHCATFNSSPPRFTYVKVGRLSTSEIQEMCKVEMILGTLWPGFRQVWKVSNISLEDIHQSLLYGFGFHVDQYWNDNPTKWDKFITSYEKGHKLPLLVVLVILVVFGAVVSPVMTIIGFIVVLGLLLSIVNHHYHNRIFGWVTFDPLDVYTDSEMAYAALLSLSQTVDLILHYHQKSISPPAKDQIISIAENVNFLQVFLEDFPEEARRFEAVIRVVTLAAEDTIEFFMSGNIYQPRYASSVDSAGEQYENPSCSSSPLKDMILEELISEARINIFF